MAENIELKSYQQIVGSMIAKLKASTDVTDVSVGSLALTILEAAAASDYSALGKLVQLLNIRNIDRATGVDLEGLAFELGVTPVRVGAKPATVSLTIKEASFTKVSTTIYSGYSSPAAGDTSLRVLDASGFPSSGVLYVGRNGKTFEAVNYISATQTGSFWTFALASPFTKDHLVGEEVLLAQGGDRLVAAGTVVIVPAFGGNPSIPFSITNDYSLLDGEDTISDVIAVATNAGSAGKVGINKINQFQSLPWSTATVSNQEAGTGGRDLETDTELRQRIKDHIHDIGRGTERSIIRNVIGISDSEENKRVVSAFLKRPTTTEDRTTLFIDDGTGYTPPFAGVGEEVIVAESVGTESFFQLQKWSLVKAQVASVGIEPFNLSGGERLYVEVDGASFEAALRPEYFRNPGVATAQEVTEAINDSFSSIVEARAKDGHVFITPIAYDPDYVRVGSVSTGADSNVALRFPIRKQYTLRLYLNDKLLQKGGQLASIQSTRVSALSSPVSGDTLQLNIDGIDSPTVTFLNSDFALYTSSQTLAGANAADWAIIMNKKFIGITAVAQDDGTFLVSSNRGKSSLAAISVIGGTLASRLFATGTSSTGKQADYKLNRLLGQIELANKLSLGDELKAGSTQTRGFVETSDNASYDLSEATSPTAPAQMVVLADRPYTAIDILQAGVITFSVYDSSTQRITGSAGQFSSVKTDDYAHLYRGPRDGVLRVKAVDSAGSWVNFYDPNPAAGSVTWDGLNYAGTFFRTEGIPQLVEFDDNASTVASDLVNQLNDQIQGAYAEVLDTGAVRLRTNQFNGEFGLSVPSIKGNANSLGLTESNYLSNDPHVASAESADFSGIPSGRLTVDTPDNTAPFDQFNVDGTPFDAASSNRGIEAYLGSSAKIIREPSERLSSNDLVLRNQTPSQVVGLGEDLRATSVSGFEFGQSDNMVFMIDNDATTKVFDIPMYVDAVVSGPSVPTTTQMDLVDTTGASLGTSSRWLGYTFEDYRIWFQAKLDLPFSAPNSQIRIKSVPFGPNGVTTRAGFVYPNLPDQELSVSIAVNPTSDLTTVQILLGSGSERALGLLPGKLVEVSSTGSNPSTVRYSFPYPADTSAIQIGDVLSANDPAFNSSNRTPVRVTAISNLRDFAQAYSYTAPNEVTASSAPSFTVAIGDRLEVGAFTLKVTSIISTTVFGVDLTSAFAGTQAGIVSRIFVEGTKRTAGVNETVTVAASQSIRVFEIPVAKNLASLVIDAINNTAGVQDVAQASNAPGNSGAGSVLFSTSDESTSTGEFLFLENGESYIYSTANASPSVRLKEPSSVAPDLGENVRLVPTTARNVADHFSKKQISGLSVAADVAVVDRGRKVQVSSKVAGGLGQVYPIGGKASGVNVLAIRNNVLQVSSTRALVELDRSSVDLLVPGHTVKISQTGRAKKQWTGASPTSSSLIEISIFNPGIGQIDFSEPFATTYSYTQSGTVFWAVRNIGRNRVRYELTSGTATIPAQLKADDWVLIGTGETYAGLTASSSNEFVSANQGWFQVVETDNANYFDIEGRGTEEFVETNSASFIFAPYHSARPGDQLVLGADLPSTTANKGTFTITSVPTTSSLLYLNETVETEAAQAIGVNGPGSISLLDQGFTCFRKVVMHAPNPDDPANRAFCTVSPGHNMSLLSEGQGARVNLPARLGFGTDPVPGVNGYSVWTGLKRKVQRVVDGFEPDPVTYPGVAAAGVSIEVREAQKTSVSIGVKVKTAKGVSLQSISDSIRTAISGYVNSLGLGEAVIMSEIIRLVQEVPGVESCVLTDPGPTTQEALQGRKVVGENAIARIASSDITLS